MLPEPEPDCKSIERIQHETPRAQMHSIHSLDAVILTAAILTFNLYAKAVQQKNSTSKISWYLCFPVHVYE